MKKDIERKRHKKKRVPEPKDVFEPISVHQFGTSDDPCFGKHHSLKADECQRCGDSEMCSIVTAQSLHIRRAEVESKQAFKDTESLPEDRDDQIGVQKLINKYAEKGYSSKKAIRLIQKRYPTADANKIKRLIKSKK